MEPNQINGRSLVMWGGMALLIAIIAIGAVKLAGNGTDKEGTAAGVDLEPVSESDWVQGDIGAPVTLIEYSDFQCPACALYFPLVEETVSAYEGKITFVYRHFPLAQHRQAKAASYASEAAGKQGKFWEMHKMLFEGQIDWAGKSDAEETFGKYASQIGLDMERFGADVKLAEIRERVDDDYRKGITAGVNSTPTFFLNGKKIQNPASLEAFKILIDAALATTT